MLKAIATINDRATLILGLSRENTVRLLDGKPILVDLDELLGRSDDPSARIAAIVVMAGETEDAMREELSQYLPLPPMPGQANA